MEFLTLKQEAFGLDISDLSLKMVKLKRKGRFFKLASFGEEKIKEGVIQGGEIKSEKALIKAIQKVFFSCQGERVKTKHVVASLPEEKAFLQVIQMPKISEEDLKSAVIYQAENYIPLPIEEVYLDFQTVRPVYNHLDHQDILITAMPKKIVDSYWFCLKKAGLEPLALEVESQAIVRALIKNETSYQPILIIDFGQTRTSFIVFSGYSLRFTASIPVSSQNFTYIISKNLDVNLNEAEKLKLKYGIEMKKGGKGREIFEALIPVLTDLVQQIRKCLSYYLTHASHEHLAPNGDEGVEKILLCGGGSTLKGFAEFLSLQLKIPVELGNPWLNILPKEEKEPNEMPKEKTLNYTAALGLALRGIKGER